VAKRKTATVAFALPDWIDPEVWAEFDNMRQKIKRPMTDYAKRLIVSELEKARGYADPNECLKVSIRRSWQDVYPDKGRTPPPINRLTGKLRSNLPRLTEEQRIETLRKLKERREK
jgi:hypothetical protein